MAMTVLTDELLYRGGEDDADPGGLEKILIPSLFEASSNLFISGSCILLYVEYVLLVLPYRPDLTTGINSRTLYVEEELLMI